MARVPRSATERIGTALSLVAGNIRNRPRRLIQVIHSATKNESIVASISIAQLIQVSIVVSFHSSPREMSRDAPIFSALKMQDLQGFEILRDVSQATRCGHSNAVNLPRAVGGVVVRLARCRVLVGQALLPVHQCCGDTQLDKQECLSYSANYDIARRSRILSATSGDN